MGRISKNQMERHDAQTKDVEKIHPIALKAQKAELTEHLIYKKLAQTTADDSNRQILEEIAGEELRHYDMLKSQTGEGMRASGWKVWIYYSLARVLGFAFAMRMMEHREDLAQEMYRKISQFLPEAEEIEQDEYRHEEKLIDLVEEDYLQYASSVVLGLNDALVELTGAIAGFTLALQDTAIIAMTSVVTGISASLSMAGSEFLSTKTDEQSSKSPLKASFYTGVAYLSATIILVLPFFLLTNHFVALGWTVLNALFLILLFNFYISVAKGYSFKRRFAQMASISLGVAVVSFFIGFLVRHYWGVTL
jgi:VIT1/CCC1 family predicted Fe2+/Mn2+ transporter